jgi:hypothetical protein
MAKTRTRNRHGGKDRSHAMDALLCGGALVVDPKGSSGAGIAGRPSVRIFNPWEENRAAVARAIAGVLVPPDRDDAFYGDTARGLMAAHLIHSMTANKED